MNSKERFDRNAKFGIKQQSDVEIIEALANKLIDALYIPVTGDEIFVMDKTRNLALCPGVDDEPINWGDLSASVTKDNDGNYLVVLQEAAEEQCPVLCEYISTYLASWGWEVTVITEW